MAQRILDAWKFILNDLVKQFFLRCGISNGNENDSMFEQSNKEATSESHNEDTQTEISSDIHKEMPKNNDY